MKKIDFCDNWIYQCKEVSVPHDAMLHEGRDRNAPSGGAGGYFCGGIYEYVKEFEVPRDWQDKSVLLNFGGVYRKAKVYVNDKYSGGCAYGYSEFTLNIKEFLYFGSGNTIKVIADNSEQPNSRWYSGGGIYRSVSLIVGEKSHIEWRGVRITTLSVNPIKVNVKTTHIGGEVEVKITDGEDTIASGKGDNLTLEIPNAKLWSDSVPNLYKCIVTLSENGEIVDEAVETFGIRNIEWSNKGLFVNGKNTLLRGGCVHSDNGILGACSYRESEFRRVKILKDAGFNAIRSSHNPASEFMLEACDYYGLMVIDETWDMWYRKKSKFDYAIDFEQNYSADIHSLVERDFNHPSVIMYSIANEISEPATERGVQLTKDMVNLFHSLDASRPVTAGINLMIISKSAKGKAVYKEDGGTAEQKDMSGMSSTMFNMMTQMVGTGMNKSANSSAADSVTSPCLNLLDICGYNYASGRYPLEGEKHPDRIIVGSETFPQDIAKNWEMVKKLPYLIGDFVWTAWDYLGEAGLGSWAFTPDGKGFNKPYPWLLAEAGMFDILGEPTGEVFLAQAVWGLLQKPQIAVQPVNHNNKTPAKMVWRGTNSIPSWSFKGCDGNRATVEVYSDAYSTELFLNNKSIGKKRIKEYKAVFVTKYVSGELKAVCYDKDSNIISENALHSASGKLKIRITAETSSEICYAKIEIVGENGVIESNADIKLNVMVEDGELLAFGSANPRTEDNYLKGEFTTYYGKAQAVIRRKGSARATMTVSGGAEISGTEVIL